MSHTPPRHASPSPLNPTTPPNRSQPLADRGPTPLRNRNRSVSRPATPESRYPPLSRNATPHRNEVGRSPLSHGRTASIATITRAAQVPLPDTPPQAEIGYSPRANDVELNYLPSRRPTPERHTSNSPFHDRHSVEVLEDESPTRQRTAPGYLFAGMRPGDKEELVFGEELDVHISEKRRSLYPQIIPLSTLMDHPDLLKGDVPPVAILPQARPSIRPRFRALFTLCTFPDIVLILLPAIFFSGAASLAPPFMSMTIGDLFQIMAQYPLDTSTATQAQRDYVYNGVREKTIWLAAAALYTIAVNYTKGVMWQWHGEVLTGRLRQKVFEGVQSRRMEWFDTGMGMGSEDGGQQAVGAGGLMAKFARETDDVRMGCSQMMGNFVQNFLTFLFCFVLALYRAPVLALVTLSTIPLVVVVQVITQIVMAPLLATERRAFAEASTDVERSTNAIATVKAHNAQTSEESRFERIISRAKASLVRQAVVWGLSLSVTDFLLLATFVSGFWYGAKAVQNGSVSSGTVMTVFWAALLAASYLQATIPCLTLMTKAKMSMASLMTVIQEPEVAKRTSTHRPLSMAKIRPQRCQGEFNFRNVSFAYPSRRDNLVLRDITLFIPPAETTFIVGGSGSGKSTIAQLLLRLYDTDGGDITMDDQSFRYLDEGFTQEHIAAVQQGCILFDMSVHDNVALGVAGAAGKSPEQVTRDEVVAACRTAMIHDFIVGLPEGYDTKLGTSGSSLSGGQKQRLAIARAVIRNPSVLILDEATSALDTTSRVAVFDNLRHWRTNRTTIVITHDLSQIVPDDFVYVMKDGVVAEQGFRSDLMKRTPAHGEPWGVFAGMAAEQAIQPLPPKLDMTRAGEIDFEELHSIHSFSRPPSIRPPSLRPASFARPQSMAYYDILDDYSRGVRFSDLPEMPQRPMSIAQKRLSWAPLEPRASMSRMGSQASLRPPSRVSRQISYDRMSRQISYDRMSRQISYDRMSRHASQSARFSIQRSTSDLDVKDIVEAKEGVVVDMPDVEDRGPPPGMFKILFFYLPTMPRKALFVVGLIGSIAHGVATPVWASFLTRLMAIVAGGGTDPMLTTYALIVLAISAAQATANYVQEYALYTTGVYWSTQIRQAAYQRVLAQDKTFFDKPINAPPLLVQNLIKDVDDLKQLVAVISGKVVLFFSMVGLGIIWALVVQWRLTLVGLALAPVFAALVVMNEVLVGRAEVRNKDKRDKVAKLFFESVSNIRGIRAMALEVTFADRFKAEARDAEITGKRTGLYIAVGLAASACLPLVAMALLNWVGCLFMLSNYLNYVQMLTVFNLVLFTLTFGSQALDFVPMLAKVKVAARDFGRLYDLPLDTTESGGTLRFPITGTIAFESVSFSYPTRPTVPVLDKVSFRLSPGECVAIVGPSGCGKSTIAALIQRLYEPTSGKIRLDDRFELSTADTMWLRNHVAVVSQTANLFDATVAENIAYGSDIPIGEVHGAAKAANIHDFIMSLPHGYETNLGENAGLISGGQAQRLQIARALVRGGNVLVLDEATSALDVENQRKVLDTIVKIKDTRTTVFITHSVEAMKRCDRIICLDEGRVVEDGPFEELVAKGGVFAQLMRMGEWS